MLGWTFLLLHSYSLQNCSSCVDFCSTQHCSHNTKYFFFSRWLLCVHWWQWSSWLPVFTRHGSWPGLITLRHTNQIFTAVCWWRTQPWLTCDGESEISTSLSLSCLVHLLMHAQHCQLLSGKKFSLTVKIQIFLIQLKKHLFQQINNYVYIFTY